MKTIHSFFLEDVYVQDSTIVTREERVIKQWSKVLRLRKKDSIHILDNHGNRYTCIIETLDRKEATLQITHKISTDRPHSRTLFLPLIPLKKIELITKIGTEIGITNFCFFSCDHGQDQMLPVISSPNKQHRLREIAKEAAEQSEKYFLPHIDFSLRNFNEVIDLPQTGVMLERGTPSKRTSGITSLLIGPEGGFSDIEKDLINDSNIEKISFPNIILRVETAAILGAGHLCLY